MATRECETLSNGQTYRPPSCAQLAEALQIAKDIHFPFDSYTIDVIDDKSNEYNLSIPPTPAHSALRQWQRMSLGGEEGGGGRWSAVYICVEAGVDPQGGAGQLQPTSFGMLRARRIGENFDDGRVCIELLLFPPLFCTLLPLIKSGVDISATSHQGYQGTGVLFPQQWQQDMKNYMNSIPAYLYPAMHVAFKRYNQQQKCVPRNLEVPMFGKILRRRLERLQAVCSADLAAAQIALYDNRRLSSFALQEGFGRDGGGKNLALVPHDTQKMRHETHLLKINDIFTISQMKFNLKSVVVNDEGSSSKPIESLYMRPVYNGGPDVTPWPVSVLASCRQRSSFDTSAPLEIFQLEACDLLRSWEELRRSMYGGGGSLAVRGMTLEGIAGSGSHLKRSITDAGVNSAGHHKKKKREMAYLDSDMMAWTWWRRACGASKVPVTSVRLC